jgi:serine/threonine protein kinase
MTSDSRTQIGVVMGTPAYMSPEQVSGRTLDHRSDIFSLGVVLHEMATGRRPFEGGSSAELISSILRDTPPPVNELRPELPADLARVIRRCLEKDPRYRLQTARDVSNEFRDLGRTITRPTPVPTSTAHAAVAADSGAVRDESGDPYTQGFSGIKRHRIALAIAVIGLVIGSVGVAAYLKRSNPGQIESIAEESSGGRSN